MAFEVIVAIDVSGGALARATSSGLIRLDAFDGDPIAAAGAAIESGVRWIHLVDLDRATRGAARNLDLIRSIAGLGVRVQASGGVVAREDVEAALSAGAERVVLGSAALVDLDRAHGAIDTFGARLAIGIEARGDRIRARGRHETDLPLAETVDALVASGAARFVVTAVPRVGSLSGPNLDLVAAVVARGRPVVAAGGIGSLDDLRLVRDTGAEGAIVGRAALERELDLRAAIAAFG
jgi:phosphoribosylformimino-5-aminoimidazole carboxamide ribonucleotide (ProFAR) isomerase